MELLWLPELKKADLFKDCALVLLTNAINIQETNNIIDLFIYFFFKGYYSVIQFVNQIALII